MARDCAELGGQTLPLIAHMRQLWDRVSFIPADDNAQENVEDEEAEEGEEEGEQQEGRSVSLATSVGQGSDTEDGHESILALTDVAAPGERGRDTLGESEEQRVSVSDSGSPEYETHPGIISQPAENPEVPVPPPTNIEGGGEEEEDLTTLEGQSNSQSNSSDDASKVSFASHDSTDKPVFPSIQEKLDKFEPNDTTKRKAEKSPELSKKDKKKSKNHGKNSRRKELQGLKLD